MIGKRYISERSDLGQERAAELAQLEANFWTALASGPIAHKVGFASVYVTGKCHLKCPHCHAEEHFAEIIGDASTEQMMRIINGVAQMTDRVQLTGGEVFMRTDPMSKKNDVPLLIDEIFRRGKETIMQTTGMHLTDELLDFFADRNVTWIALSLDGPDAAYNSRIRGTDVAFEKTIEWLPKLKRRGFKVKVGTAVTSLNKDVDKMLELGRLVVSLGADHWKLYQFYGREIGRASGMNADVLAVSDEDYNAIMDAITAEFGSEQHTGIVRHDLDTFYNSPALLVQPNGITTIMKGTKDIEMGNVLVNSPQQILLNLVASGSDQTITLNSVKTY